MQQGPPPQTLRYYQSPPIRRYISQIAIGQHQPQKPSTMPGRISCSIYFRTSHYSVKRNNGFHEVIVVEAKKSTGRAPTAHKWNGVRQQLQDNMLAFRNRLGNVQTMYGVAAVESRARFYVLFMNQNVLVSDTEDGILANDECGWNNN
ncbi:hypothetical protein ASPTUDRAFT_191236 [Aspergillus tubingensis CBS 134.48]|uniref:Uncharacterized protein n=1 Tax=Aspergillus tubingensis (strain CBS 134.48) TaxID=767770 RepID=A0A1L9N0B2_ASPTC|nr:hypothetical protein ASPTUDRAFT_191236 [Aspergillus tubingensis CBS 134.48]